VNIHIDYTVVQHLSDGEIITAHTAWTCFREVWHKPITLTWTFEEQPGQSVIEGTADVLPLEGEQG
jgi:hypothetical protein